MIMAIILGIYFLVVAIKGFSQPFWALVGLLSVTMINPGELYPFFAVLRMEKIFVIIVLISWLIHEKVVIPPISRKLLYFLGALVVSIPFAYWKMGAFSGTLTFLTVVLYHLLMINLVTDTDRFRKIVTAYVALIGWIAAGSVWAYMHGDIYAGGARNGLERAQGMTSSAGDPNSLGVRMVVAMPLMILLIAQGSKGQKLFGWIVLGLSIFTVTLTGSRGSMATLVLIAAIFMLTRKKGLLLAPVAVVVLAVAFNFIPESTKQRYLEIGDVLESKEMDESYMNRVNARIAGWHMFLDYPITGVGAGVFKYANGGTYWPAPGRKHWLQAHNTYIQLLADTGLLGTVTWLIFFGTLVGITWRLRAYFRAHPDVDGVFRYYPTACLFSIATMLINSYSTHQLYSGAWYFLAALSGTLYYRIYPEANPQQRQPFQEVEHVIPAEASR